MEELLNTVPGISTANGAPPQGTSINSFYAPQIHQLGRLDLQLHPDGGRWPAPAGAGGDTLADPNIIPTAAIERVEVLADGASSIYGSDAVSGVVNFITRKSYEGLEMTCRLVSPTSTTPPTARCCGAPAGTRARPCSPLAMFQSRLRGQRPRA